MKQLTRYIQEKLHISKYKKEEIKKLTPNNTEYKGVKLTEQNKRSKEDFNKYGSIHLNEAYEIIQIIIDNCEEELNGYYLSIFYSGYSGFTILNPNFDGQNADKYKEGIICFYAYANKTGYKVHFDLNKSTDATLRLKEFIGEDNDKFNI